MNRGHQSFRLNRLQLNRLHPSKEPFGVIAQVQGDHVEHGVRCVLTDALELGTTDYLLKPLDQAQLVKLLVGDVKE